MFVYDGYSDVYETIGYLANLYKSVDTEKQEAEYISVFNLIMKKFIWDADFIPNRTIKKSNIFGHFNMHDIIIYISFCPHVQRENKFLINVVRKPKYFNIETTLFLNDKKLIEFIETVKFNVSKSIAEFVREHVKVHDLVMCINSYLNNSV